MNRAVLRLVRPTAAVAVLAAGFSAAKVGPAHPRLVFDAAELASVRAVSSSPALAPLRARVLGRAERLLSAPPLSVSRSLRGEPDPPGESKGIESARRLQGRVVTHAVAFLLSGDRRFRDAALRELDRALTDWWTWVDTAHQPPYDLMTGETSLTFGLAYDWLYDALTPEERARLREGAERRSLRPYLAATTAARPMFWFSATHNWNPVCNGGAAVLALAIADDDPALAGQVLRLAAPAMAPYWEHLKPDGGWDEGTGYWTYGHRYAFIAADALRRTGWKEGADYLGREGARRTGYFPLVFNPGRQLSASFGDSPGRASDALFYFLAREYRNPDFAWFQDRAAPRGPASEGWPDEALSLVWRAATSPPAVSVPDPTHRPLLPPTAVFPSIGWALLAPSQPDPPFFLAFKNGSLAANHSHLDLNHVSVGVGNTMLLGDLGSRPYPADYFDASRRYAYYEISTAGHNTVTVDGKGQVPGRLGLLKGPVEGPRHVALVGVADAAYPAPASRVRRHVVFVDRRYFVLLDEIDLTEPAPIELRFHTYGSITPRRYGGWTVAQDGRAVHLVPAAPAAVTAMIESPPGWIREVRALRLSAARAGRRFLLATAIIPDREPARMAITQQLRGAELQLRIGSDRLTFADAADGFSLAAVALGGGGR